MPSPELDFLFSDAYSEADWHESIMHGRSDTLSPDRSSCSITVSVPYDQYKAAVKFILGYQWIDASNNLRRFTPVFHPVYSWLYASAITNVTFKGPDDTNRFTPAFPYAVYAGGYQWAEIEVEFRERLYDLWQDWEVDTEDERWTYQTREPYTELAQIDGGQLKYVAPSVSAVNGNPIAAPHILAPLQKARINFTWYQVPTEFVEDEDGYSAKFQSALKCLNLTTFRGRVAGTLLLEQIKLDKKPSPVSTDVAAGLRFTYDITFEMIEFNPPTGDASVTITGTTAYAGHNLLPGPKSTGASGDRAFKFFLATDTGTLAGKPLFAFYEYAKLFTHHSLT